MASRAILLGALSTFIFANTVRAYDPLLNRITPAEAVSKADTIFIGKLSITDEGALETSPISVSVNEIKILRGNEPSQIAFLIGTDAKRVKGGITLKTGGAYIFFLISDHTGSYLFKILPVTDENVSLVKKLISN